MNSVFYIRLVDHNRIPLEEYIGAKGDVIPSRDNLDDLLQFANDRDAKKWMFANQKQYPGRHLQLMQAILDAPLGEVLRLTTKKKKAKLPPIPKFIKCKDCGGTCLVRKFKGELPTGVEQVGFSRCRKCGTKAQHFSGDPDAIADFILYMETEMGVEEGELSFTDYSGNPHKEPH